MIEKCSNRPITVIKSLPDKNVKNALFPTLAPSALRRQLAALQKKEKKSKKSSGSVLSVIESFNNPNLLQFQTLHSFISPRIRDKIGELKKAESFLNEEKEDDKNGKKFIFKLLFWIWRKVKKYFIKNFSKQGK